MVELTKGSYKIIINDVGQVFLELKNEDTGKIHTLWIKDITMLDFLGQVTEMGLFKELIRNEYLKKHFTES